MVTESRSGRDVTAARTTVQTGADAIGETPTGELVAQAARQVSELVRDELALAKTELVDKGKRAGFGAGLFGGAGLIAWFGVATLIGAAVAGLAVAWPTWLAALVVGVVLLAVAGILALTGRRQLSQAVPPVPAQATESVKADVHEIKDRLSEGHHQ
jgi:Putative Actinobacterial Holin-X, holin superfamily III